MSRRIRNSGLGNLCSIKNLQIADLECMTETSRRAILIYSTGRRHFPILEAKLATIFKLSVPELRHRLRLSIDIRKSAIGNITNNLGRKNTCAAKTGRKRKDN